MIILSSSRHVFTDALASILPSDFSIRKFDGDDGNLSQFSDIDVLLAGPLSIGETLIKGAPKLRLIHQHGVGTDKIDLAAAKRSGITVAIAKGSNASSVAEHAFAMMLCLLKNINKPPVSNLSVPTRDVRGAKLVIVGHGDSGRILGKIAVDVGMSVSFVTRNPNRLPPIDSSVDVVGLERLDQSIRSADVVSLNCPLDSSSYEIIGQRQIELFRDGSVLVNVARPALVDFRSTVPRLRDGSLNYAVDGNISGDYALVRELEAAGNLLVTAHFAGFSASAVEAISSYIAKNICNLHDGRPIEGVVNYET